jgi:hypothetical protein
MPRQLTNPVLLGSLLLPIGLMPRFHATDDTPDEPETAIEAAHRDATDGPAGDGGRRPRGRNWAADRRERRPKPPVLKIGILPIARRDSERLRQVLSVQSRLRDLESSARSKRALMHRGPFEDALTWLEIHGRAPEIVEHWRGFIEATGAPDMAPATPGEGASEGAPDQPRRRRRRGGRRRGGRYRRPTDR